MEFLHPSFAPYFTDLISWGAIGSRTSSSQVHRQLASSLPFAVGFKNSHHEAIDITLQSIYAARASHVFPSIDEEGHLASIQSHGNPFAHIVLRGNRNGPNHDEKSIDEVVKKSRSLGSFFPIIIDCSHENSSKNLEKQKECFRKAVLQKNKSIAGYMLESHLFSGNQSLPSPEIQYGISVTDPCLGWEETEALICAADQVREQFLI
jgi:3-deoxy-7-phosphoheptulonate synthase